MKKTTETAEKRCPKCGKTQNQAKKGFNRSGTQKVYCKECGANYTLNPKQNAYSEETQKLAIKIFYSGVSGREVGKILDMNKSNVYNWIKKTLMGETAASIQQVFTDCYELDELYWFIERKPRTETRENVYIMTMVSREPRQIAGLCVAQDKRAFRIQSMVDGAPWAEKYCTDGYVGYLDVVYPGVHVRNMRDKSDTFTVEGVNADLRHYIPLLRRRSRCFARSLETLQAVCEVFADAYNCFGAEKVRFRQLYPLKVPPFLFPKISLNEQLDTPTVRCSQKPPASKIGRRLALVLVQGGHIMYSALQFRADMLRLQTLACAPKAEKDIVVVIVLHEGEANRVMRGSVGRKIIIGAKVKNPIHDGLMDAELDFGLHSRQNIIKFQLWLLVRPRRKKRLLYLQGYAP